MRLDFLPRLQMDNTGQTGTATIAGDDIGGVIYQRNKIVIGPDNTNDGDVHKGNPMPFWDIHTGRTEVHYYATGIASGATGVETLITLQKALGTAAVTSGTSQTPTSGKRFRATSITFASRGHATATAQVTTFSFRLNTAGAITTGSPVRFQARTATPATALAWDRITISLPNIGYEILGDGTLQIGVTGNAVFVTNAPTWDVWITGVEY